MVSCQFFTILNFQRYYLKKKIIVNVVIIKKICGSSPGKRLVTLNEHYCFITLICLKHFSKPRKDRYIFLLKSYFVKIKNKHGTWKHGNVHFNYFLFQIFFYECALSINYQKLCKIM